MVASLQYKKISLALVVGLVVFLLSQLAFNNTQSALLGLIGVLVALWTNEGLPLAVVSLLPIVLFPAFGITDTKITTSNYAHPIIFLFLGGFLLAIAVEKCGLHTWIADKMLHNLPQYRPWYYSIFGDDFRLTQFYFIQYHHHTSTYFHRSLFIQ